MATYPAAEPSYCADRSLMSKPPTPSQWATCVKYGWDEPTTTLGRLGHDFGHSVLPTLIILAVIYLAIRFLFRR